MGLAGGRIRAGEESEVGGRLNKETIAKSQRDIGAKYVLVVDPGPDEFFLKKESAELIRAYKGYGEVMEINEYIEKKQEATE